MRESEVKRFVVVSIIGLLGLIGIEILLGIFGLMWNSIIYWVYGIFFGWIILGAIPLINRIWNGRSKESNVVAIVWDWESKNWKGSFIDVNGSIHGGSGDTPDEAYDKLMPYLKELGGW